MSKQIKKIIFQNNLQIMALALVFLLCGCNTVVVQKKEIAKKPVSNPKKETSHTIKLDFKQCKTENFDTSTYPEMLSLSGAYSTDKNSVLLLHFNKKENPCFNSTANGLKFANKGAIWNKDGQFSGCLDFVNNGLLIGKEEALLNLTTGKLSLEGWIKINALPNPKKNYALFGKGGYADGYRLVLKSYGNIVFQIGKKNGGKQFSSKRHTINPGSWVHLAVTYDSSMPVENLKLYINGMLNKSYNCQLPILPSSRPFSIGKSDGIGYFKGAMDEIRVSNIARTKKEIAVSRKSDYFESGQMISPILNKPNEKVTRASVNWNAEKPQKSQIIIFLSNDNGKTWLHFDKAKKEVTFPKPDSALRVKAVLKRGYGTPKLKKCDVIYYNHE